MSNSIQRLNAGTLSTGASIPFYDPANGRDARASLAELATALGLPVVALMLTMYSSPIATGFAVSVSPGSLAVGGSLGQSVRLLLAPTGAFAAGTIALPAQADCRHDQEILVSCTQAVTTLTVAGNGSTVNGAPTTLAANAFFTLRFDGVNKAWYRVA